MESSARDSRMMQLDFFIGTWNMDVIHPHLLPNPISGRSKFEWLEEKYLIQRTHIDKSEFPDHLIVFDWDSFTKKYFLHYFDSRGITRLYQMTIENGIWTLLRDKPDFSPLSFFQRFIGAINEEKTIIEGSWEKSDDGANWEHDLKVVYRKE